MPSRIADERGFTLIELLVVILIIGILAAIAVPNFLRQRERSYDAAAQANARNTVSHIEACFVKTDDYRKCTSLAELGTGIGISIGTEGNQVGIQADADTGYKITGYSKTGVRFYIEKAANTWIMDRTCEVPDGAKDRGGCPDTGKW